MSRESFMQQLAHMPYVKIVEESCVDWTYTMKNVNNVVEREREREKWIRTYFLHAHKHTHHTCMESICLPLN